MTHVLVRNQCVHDLRPVRRRISNEIQYAVRQAGLGETPGNEPMTPRGLLRRLHHHRVPQHQRSRNRRSYEQYGGVPRHNARYHANWLADRQSRSVRVVRRDDLPRQSLVGRHGCVSNFVDQKVDVEVPPPGRAAHLGGHCFGNFGGVLLHFVGTSHQDPEALGRRTSRPHRERLSSGLYSTHDILRGRCGCPGGGVTGVGIQRFIRRATGRRSPAAANQQLLQM